MIRRAPATLFLAALAVELSVAHWAGVLRYEHSWGWLLHATPAHLALNVCALLLVGMRYEHRAGTARWLLWAGAGAAAAPLAWTGWGAAAPGSGAGLYGLSAVNFALLAGAMAGIERAGWARLVLAALLAHAFVELVFGVRLTPATSTPEGVSPAPAAHLGAAALGAAAGLSLALARRRTASRVPPSPATATGHA